MDPLLIWGISLIGLSVLLLIIEIFVPTGGILALTAGVVGISGVVCLFMVDQNGPLWGSLGIVSLLIAFPAALYLWSHLLEGTTVGRKLIGADALDEQQRHTEEVREEQLVLNSLVGEEGEALTDMLPVGKIRIGQQRYEALAQGRAIEQGDRVRVTGVSGTQLVVRPV